MSEQRTSQEISSNPSWSAFRDRQETSTSLMRERRYNSPSPYTGVIDPDAYWDDVERMRGYEAEQMQLLDSEFRREP